MNLRHKFVGIFVLFVLSLHVGAIRSEDWPHWRGVRRNDISSEMSGWDGKVWQVQGIKWTKTLGQGSCSPLVVGQRVYDLGWNNGQDTLFCLDAETGKEIWQTSYKCPRYGRFKTGDEGLYAGPTATPEFDEQTGHLYTLSVDGHLNAWNTAEQGKQVWGLNLYDDYGIGQRPKLGRQGRRDYGYTTAPLVQGETLIVEVGDDTGAVMGFDKKNGKRRWTSQFTGFAGHTGGPVPLIVEGVPCVAVLTQTHLLVLRLDAGREGQTVATYEWTTDFANNIAAPAVQGNELLITSGYNREAMVKLEISLQGAKKLWEQPYYSKICTPIIHNGHVYWSYQEVHCLDWKTGQLMWKGGRFGDAGSCILTKDEKLIVWGGRGDLALVETAPTAKKYQELAHRPRLLSSDVWPHVVLADRRLLCKNRLGQLHSYPIAP